MPPGGAGRGAGRAGGSGGGQPGDSPVYAYLFFCSNFNGEWEQYIDAFSSVIPGGMNLIWDACVGYPGSQPITPFLAYIRQNQFDTDYYFSAYPGASTADIRGALDLVAQMNAFADKTADIAPDEFKAAYERFLVGIAGDLSTTGQAPWATDPDEPIMPELDVEVERNFDHEFEPSGVLAPPQPQRRIAPLPHADVSISR